MQQPSKRKENKSRHSRATQIKSKGTHKNKSKSKGNNTPKTSGSEWMLGGHTCKSVFPQIFSTFLSKLMMSHVCCLDCYIHACWLESLVCSETDVILTALLNLRIWTQGVGARHVQAHTGAHIEEHAAAPYKPAGAATPRLAAVAAAPATQQPEMQDV